MSTVPLAELNFYPFYRTERPRLIADGVTDYNAQCTELKRRWNVLQAIKAAAPPPAPVLAVGEVGLDAPLGADDISVRLTCNINKSIVVRDHFFCIIRVWTFRAESEGRI